MKQILKTLFVAIVLVLSLFSAPSITNATTPTLSVYTSGGNDSVVINVYGDSYASVIIHYQNSNYGTQSQYLGTTNSNGYFSTTINASTYGIMAGSFVRVVVNNQTSSDVAWPHSYNNYVNYNYNQLTLNQTNISVSVGQSLEVTISGGNMPYTMYPVGANIFQAVISGNKLQVAGLNAGNGSINVCSSGGTGSGCAIVYVTVNQNNYYNPTPTPYPYNSYWQPVITFSQNNPNLTIGQSVTIQVSGGNNYYNYNNNSYYIGHNSNSNNVSAVINGNSLTLRGLANGNMSIVVCSSSANCSAINVVVGSTNPPIGGNWVSCASEGQFCYFSGTKTVQYGANGVYVYRTVSNGTPCSNAVFGDPIFGVAKKCSYSGENYQY